MRINIGETYIGTVTAIESYGAVLKFKDDSTQLLHISHISDDFVQDISDFLHVGDSVEVFAVPGKVKSVELTVRQSEIDKYNSLDGKSFEELLNDYPPNERDIRYKDRMSSDKKNVRKKSKRK